MFLNADKVSGRLLKTILNNLFLIKSYLSFPNFHHTLAIPEEVKHARFCEIMGLQSKTLSERPQFPNFYTAW